MKSMHKIGPLGIFILMITLTAQTINAYNLDEDVDISGPAVELLKSGIYVFKLSVRNTRAALWETTHCRINKPKSPGKNAFSIVSLLKSTASPKAILNQIMLFEKHNVKLSNELQDISKKVTPAESKPIRLK